MTEHSTRFPRFYITAEGPCPYLPGHTERKVFTELRGPDAQMLNEALGLIGFRRSQNVAYRQSCIGCNACISVRIVTAGFHPSKSERRVLRQHSDLEATACDAWATEEQYELLHHYLEARHPGGGMAEMDAYSYAEMVETSPVDTVVVEYRERTKGPKPGKLVAACLTDRQSDGLSMIYSFYDVSGARSGLGTYMILDHTIRARQAGLNYVYLGYWVKGSATMDYKRRFRPLEMLTERGWELMPEELHKGL